MDVLAKRYQQRAGLRRTAADEPPPPEPVTDDECYPWAGARATSQVLDGATGRQNATWKRAGNKRGWRMTVGQRRDGAAVRRPRGQHLGHPRRGRELQRALGPGRADQGRRGRGHPVAGRRVRLPRHPGQRRLARHHPDPGAPAGKLRRRSATSFPRSAGSARSATSSTASCSWSHRPTSPARSCTSTAARPRAARPAGRRCPGCHLARCRPSEVARSVAVKRLR